MTNLKNCIFAIILMLPMIAQGQETTKDQLTERTNSFLKQIFNYNNKFAESLTEDDFDDIHSQQNPTSTVVACSDSRVQTHALHKSSINEIFTIRNIGNQIKSNEGSVEYGIYHLKTPVLLIIGHSHCGAIKAAMGDYSNELPAIQTELNNLHLRKGENVDKGVIENIHQQVAFATKRFKDKITADELVVIGAVYDFRNDFGHGHGRLFIIDINGETDVNKLKTLPYLKDIENVNIGISE